MDTKLTLTALKTTNFDWTCSLGGVWDNSINHVSGLNQDVIDELMLEVQLMLVQGSNPLGKVVVGTAGSGKTHLLGELRRQVLTQGVSFILCDMTDINNFWQTLSLEYVQSLDQSIEGDLRQIDILFHRLFEQYQFLSVGESFETFCQADPVDLKRLMNQAITRLLRKNRPKKLIFVDTFRALLMFCHQDFETMEAGYCWLQGLGIEAHLCEKFGLSSDKLEPAIVVEGISWVLSLVGPTVLAFDQLDAIVSQNTVVAQAGQEASASLKPEFLSQKLRALSIIHGISGGLMGVRDRLSNTLTVVSCLEETWNVLREQAVQSLMDRFSSPYFMQPLTSVKLIEHLVCGRLKQGLQSVGIENPPFASYPFPPTLFQDWVGLTPRLVLKQCEQHRSIWLKQGWITSEDERTEILTEDDEVDKIRQRFLALTKEADLSSFKQEFVDSDIFEKSLQDLCFLLLIQEKVAFEPYFDSGVDTDFAGHTGKPLHARLRFIQIGQGEREFHVAFRAVQQTNARAFQTRLNASITASGIDKALMFRRLILIRTTKLPGGTMTSQLIAHFKSAGGIFHKPSDLELSQIAALSQLYLENPEGLEEWLQRDRPLSHLGLMVAAGIMDNNGHLLLESRFIQSAATSPISEKLAVNVERGMQPNSHSRENQVALFDKSMTAYQSLESKVLESNHTSFEPRVEEPLLLETADDDVLFSSSINRKSVQDFRSSSPVWDSSKANDELTIGREIPSQWSNENDFRESANLQQAKDCISVGSMVEEGEGVSTEGLSLDLGLMSKHIAVLAGAGAEKTVLVSQMIESIAALKRPVVVIDTYHNYKSFERDTEFKNHHAFESSNVFSIHHKQDQSPVVSLDPVMNLSSILDHDESLNVMIGWMCGVVVDLLELTSGKSLTAKENAFLNRAMRAFVLQKQFGLKKFGYYIQGMAKNQAADMVEISLPLANRILELHLFVPWLPMPSYNEGNVSENQEFKNPLSFENIQENPITLMQFDLDDDAEGLQEIYLKSLGIHLIQWIEEKKKEKKTEALSGLIVIDDADTVFPARAEGSLKNVWMEVIRKASQTGVGLVFVTQEPASLDPAIIHQCSTQCFGQIHSPAAWQSIESLIQQKDSHITRQELKSLDVNQYWVLSSAYRYIQKIELPLLDPFDS